MAAVPVLLILLQPDLGSALVLGMLTIGVVAASAGNHALGIAFAALMSRPLRPETDTQAKIEDQ